MRPFHLLLVAAIVGCAAANTLGQAPEQPPTKQIEELLIRPDVVFRHRDKLGVSDEQWERIRATIEEAGSVAESLQAKTNQAMGKLAELLSSDSVAEEAALEQLDQVLAAEKEQKRLHMKIMVRLRNELTAEQRKVAEQLQRSEYPAEGREQRLKDKITRIQDAMQARARAGQRPTEVIAQMQKFPELMQAGQVNEGEALLDRVMEMLELKPEDAESHPKPGLPENAGLPEKIRRMQEHAQKVAQKRGDLSHIQKLMQQVESLMQQNQPAEAEQLLDKALQEFGAEKPADHRSKTDQHGDAANRRRAAPLGSMSPSEVSREVAALKKPDVAWRKISWKTCLLDGIQASREQKKPIMLWIFIDRPIDDERC